MPTTRCHLVVSQLDNHAPHALQWIIRHRIIVILCVLHFPSWWSTF